MIELLSVPFDDWSDALARLPHEEAVRTVRELHRAWIEGEVGAGPFVENDITAADRRIGRFFQWLPDSLRDCRRVVRMAHGETEVRRWCWAPGWWLIDQDEDLMLMDDANVVPLLEEAREGCTKRDAAIAYVEHHLRDHAHAAVWMGSEACSERLALTAEWGPLARSASAPILSAYLVRLGSYAGARRVPREEMDARVFDLRRCSPDVHVPPEVEREGSRWVARLDRAGVEPGRLVVEVSTGKMWGELEPKRRRNRGGAGRQSK